MAEAIPMLALSPTMNEGTIAAWKLKEGDSVSKGAVLCEVETDKAVMDYESSDAGILLKIVAPAGESVSVGDLIAVIGKAGEDISSILSAAAKKAPASEKSAAEKARPEKAAAAKPAADKPGVPTPKAAAPSPAPSQKARDDSSQNAPSLAPLVPPSSPLARVLAREAGLDLREISASGPNGRVVKRDIEAYLSQSQSRPASKAPSQGQAAPTGREAAPRPVLSDRVVPLTRVRATIARRLSESMREAPHFFLRSAIEADRLLELRKQLNEGRPDLEKISLNSLFVKLSASAIALNPDVNAIWKGDSIEYRSSVDIALAVALPEGLVAPVVRDCTNKGLLQIETELRALIVKAKASSLKPEDYEGATFTISNLGAWGVEEFTAIINAPGSSILALGAIGREPVVSTDGAGKEEIQIRSLFRGTLSCDHRSIDGALGAAFLKDLKALIQEPARALL
ncbi:pyruvate dehydrogenase complex dihydrolipoamide acetyltransferase [Treponema sp.]